MILVCKVLIFHIGLSIFFCLSAGTIVHSKHDLSATNFYGPSTSANKEICVFCHTPHGSSSTLTPLWNRTITNTAAFQMYGESSSQGHVPSMASIVCLSCHDGVSSQGVSAVASADTHSLINPPTTDIGGPNCTACHFGASGTYPSKVWQIGPNLSDDHPVSVSYTTALTRDPTGFVANPVSVKLFGAGKDVECATCHDVHDPDNGSFLRVNNAGSALCNTCHIR